MYIYTQSIFINYKKIISYYNSFSIFYVYPFYAYHLAYSISNTSTFTTPQNQHFFLVDSSTLNSKKVYLITEIYLFNAKA